MTKPETADESTSGDAGRQNRDALRIYVACLAAYNNGHLHGRWIDATQDADTIQSEISQMLVDSPMADAEEWAIHDHEGFGGATLHAYSGIERIVTLAEFIVERGRLGAEVLDHLGGNLDDAEAAFDEYAGEHKSLADFARDMIEETTEIPESLVNYIDYEAIARDMKLNGDVFTVELGFEEVHVFWSR